MIRILSMQCARRLAAAGMAAALLGGCAAQGGGMGQAAASDPGEAEAKLGIRVSGLHLSAHGYVLDLRYRVVDKAKAAPLLDTRKKVYLVDEAHGAKLGVPESPVIGGMRQSARNYTIYTDRDYFILFVNPGRAVRPGDTLKLAVDDTTVAELKVQ